MNHVFAERHRTADASGGLWRGLEGDEPTRVRLASRSTTPPTVLRALANDPSITVRAAVAMNPAHAPGADRHLLADPDQRVRALLAEKMARLLPDASSAGRAAAQAHVQHTLLELARDAASRVRISLANVLTAMPEAPREVILRLAQDPDIAVSGPVARFSPLLTDMDLLELLACPASKGVARAVAGRSGLSAEVSDYIAAHADSSAVRALLANASATIREATLDALVGRAGDHPEWHEPLVCRPALPARALQALSRIVAGRLLAILANRADVPASLAQTLKTRLDMEFGWSPLPAVQGAGRASPNAEAPESALLAAASAGDQRMVAAVLAKAANVQAATLGLAMELRNAKALVSLAWKAGFSMYAAQVVQRVLGRLGPGEVLSGDAETGFPLSREEMDWQIELLTEAGR